MALRRGDIYFLNLNPVQGREQAGERPVLILSIDVIDQQPLVVTVVIGTKGENVPRDYPTNVRVPSADSGLPIETVFLCFQIRSLDRTGFRPRLPAKFTGRSSAGLRRPCAIAWDCKIRAPCRRYGTTRRPRICRW